MELANDFASKLPSGVPVFFYHSTNDESVPFEHLTLYSRKLPNATFRKITGGGHQLNSDLSMVVQDIRKLV
jgi:pimeloyl-ACP methyl ester carboxylesterase